MILLDTNVICEVLRPRPSGQVLAWLAAQDQTRVFTTAITLSEIFSGLRALPAGRRRGKVQAAVQAMFAQEFAGRILPFEETAAAAYVEIVAARELAGRPIHQFDALIAAIALSRGGQVATRNIRDFEGCGVPLIDPWTARI